MILVLEDNGPECSGEAGWASTEGVTVLLGPCGLWGFHFSNMFFSSGNPEM